MSKILPPLHFDNTADITLKKALNDTALNYLKTHQDHRYADWKMVIKLIILLLVCSGCYSAALLQSSMMNYFICYFLFITSSMLLAINVVHDASHNVFFKSSKANTWLNRFITIPLGIDPDCWRIRHVLRHHSFTNIEGYDLDIDYNGFLRQTPFQPHHWFMRYQHLYWPLVAGMTFPVIIWLFDWQDRLGIKFNRTKFTHQGLYGWTVFIAAKIAHLSVAIIIPVVVCPQFSLWSIIGIYFISQMCSSLIFVILILGSHWAKATFYQVPNNFKFTHGQIQHVFHTTLNWRLKSPNLEYWLGGINLHLTHHVYPGFSHRHYQKLTDILYEISQQHGIESQEITVKQLFVYQQLFLKKMGESSSNSPQNINEL